MMHIGLDFDNTIVSYDSLFHKVALEQRLIDPQVPRNKVAVRDQLRRDGKEAVWIEMQGYVYGARMAEAEIFPGVIDFVQGARAAGHLVTIVSHKTRRPFAGPQYDLHEAAKSWIVRHLVAEGGPLFQDDHYFFELTKDEKLARIRDIRCDAYVDDLPEILLADTMPPNVIRVLFDPEFNHRTAADEGLVVAESWKQIGKLLGV